MCPPPPNFLKKNVSFHLYFDVDETSALFYFQYKRHSDSMSSIFILKRKKTKIAFEFFGAIFKWGTNLIFHLQLSSGAKLVRQLKKKKKGGERERIGLLPLVFVYLDAAN